MVTCLRLSDGASFYVRDCEDTDDAACILVQKQLDVPLSQYKGGPETPNDSLEELHLPLADLDGVIGRLECFANERLAGGGHCRRSFVVRASDRDREDFYIFTAPRLYLQVILPMMIGGGALGFLACWLVYGLGR